MYLILSIKVTTWNFRFSPYHIKRKRYPCIQSWVFTVQLLILLTQVDFNVKWGSF